MRRGLASRQKLAGARIADVRTDDLSREPVETVAGVYRTLGLDFTPEVRAAVRAESLRHPKDAHGAHVYSPEDFGLAPDRLAERFADYHAAFGLAEPRRGVSVPSAAE